MTRVHRRQLACACTAVLPPIGGCAQAPAFDVMGSLFPAWLFCIVAGVLLAAVAHWFLVRNRIALLFPLLAYPCLAAVFTFTIWLVFF